MKSILFFWLAILAVSSAHAEVSVTDDLGNRVVLAHPARRIVSLAPHNTENVFTARAGQWLVGVVDHSDFPEAAKSIPRIGNYKQINMESLLALKPDLVLVWASGNPPEMLKKLEQLGLTLFYSEPKKFPQVVDNIRKLSVLTGTARQVTPELKTLLADYAALKDSHKGVAPVSVFYQLWDEPLITLNGNQLVSNAIEVCGGRNIFADLPMLAPRVNVEGVLAKNPDVILIASHDSEKPPSSALWTRWKHLKAVANHQIFSVNGNLLHRHTARFLLGMKRVCGILDQVRQNAAAASSAARKTGTTSGVSE